jgi:hypothetical protein
MKLTKKQQEFIKDAYSHSDVSQTWKNLIKDNFPKLFEATELEVGKWYYNDYNQLWFVTKIKDYCAYGYGFKSCGEWACESKKYNYSLDLKPATDEEVEQALIKEAKKRGFKKGVVAESVYDKHYSGIIDGEFSVQDGQLWCDALDNCYSIQLFKDGKWATPINTITKKEAEEKLNCVI